MKYVSALSSVVATGAVVLSLVFSQHATAFYGVAVSAAVVLIAAGDYAPRARRWQPRPLASHHVVPHRPKQNLRLAA